MLQTHAPRSLKTPVGKSTLAITDITAEASRLDAFDDHERVWHGRDEKRGLNAIVAIHDTTLGPGLGGTRVWPHETFEAALTDVLRLSRGMTFKSAVAGMDFGGGKALIIADPKTDKTPALLEAYAEMLAALEGQFFTGEDVGFTVADADFLRARTPNVTGTTVGGSGNPSPVTAHGVFLGLKAALKHRGVGRLDGVHVAVQGLGSVGWTLCEKLHAEGARLTVADIDAARTRKAGETFGAEPVATDAILAVPAQVFAPCALGGVLSATSIPSLGARIVAGAANNQLARHEDARLLMQRGVLYAPDYVINAGGLINVAAELAPGGYDREATMAKVAEIPETLRDIFERAEAQDRPTNDIAAEIAYERINAARKRH
ncbi:Glu/Leu/Phe/Val dehydrogenase [Nitratireductor sp. ZSWI3]|uniref:Glu/Leu/Phe/Val family dehydrogenase n=1 Tax=Nitratireductor sp. ZSWI3 TaxID=2966359 RepID=UPI00214F78DC|nr:Glu/Leu/Phe/Val dehydrogenase dimerization domain-containing protein [Nitratireductor sp. ZSWI3]MCR4267409.1 amino acid dehydrogenase [Nitratireductor sp. ZSWI3]